MGSAIFWGIILIFIGLSLIVKVVFQIDFPIFKILLAVILILLGIKILFGDFHIFRSISGGSGGETVFSERYFEQIPADNQFSAVFGSNKIDLTDIEIDEAKKIKVNVAFGNTEIILSNDIPVKIKVEVAFGSAKLPEGESGGFGATNYESPDYIEGTPALIIKGNVAFGELVIRYR